MAIWKKEAYVVAAAPAFVFLSVYFYEWGRYTFFKVPPIFLSLPTTRVLIAGVVISIFFVWIFSFVRGALQQLRHGGKFSQFVAIFVATYLVIGLPLALRSNSAYAFWSTFAPPLLITTVSSIGHFFDVLRARASKDASSGSPETARAQPVEPPTLGAIAFIFMYGLFLISSLGNGQERWSGNYVCSGGKIMVATFGEQMILKSVDERTGTLGDAVYLKGLEGAKVTPCSPKVHGRGGFSGWMQGGKLMGTTSSFD